MAVNDDIIKKREAVLSFGVNNNDLAVLKKQLETFNPFKVLGIQDFEIRHSNVLSWLLNPKESHGMADAIFKSVLLEAMIITKDDEIENYINAGFDDLIVRREWGNIDLLAVSHRNNVVLVIENKIKAGESKHQLENYIKKVGDKYPAGKYKQVFVFLTLYGSQPSSSRYIAFSHGQIYDFVKYNVNIERDNMNPKVYNFIWDYLKILEDKTVPNESLTTLCSKLYRENKIAIDTIIQYGRPKLQPENIREFHSRTETISVNMDRDIVNVYYPFIPLDWTGKVPLTNKYTSDRYLVFFYWNFSEYENHKITLSVNIGNFPDADERKRFIECISEAVEADKSSRLTLRNSKSSTRVFSKVIMLENAGGEAYDLEDYESVIDKMVKSYKSPEVKQVFQVLDGVVQKFEFQDLIKP